MQQYLHKPYLSQLLSSTLRRRHCPSPSCAIYHGESLLWDFAPLCLSPVQSALPPLHPTIRPFTQASKPYPLPPSDLVFPGPHNLYAASSPFLHFITYPLVQGIRSLWFCIPVTREGYQYGACIQELVVLGVGVVF